MDELRVWNVERTAIQISSNMRTDVSNQTGLKAYYKYENNFTDSSGNSNTLTNNGGATFSSSVPFTNYDGNGGQFLFNFI